MYLVLTLSYTHCLPFYYKTAWNLNYATNENRLCSSLLVLDLSTALFLINNLSAPETEDGNIQVSKMVSKKTEIKSKK